MMQKWGKEAVIKDASKYETKAEWRTSSPSAYVVACRNKWVDTACAHMIVVKRPNGYWTPARIQAESKKYSSTVEWNRLSAASYSVAKKARLVPDTLVRGKIHGQWTKAKVREVAVTCKTRSEFRSTYPSAYTIAAAKGWLDDVCEHMLNKAPWFGPRVIREFLMTHDICFLVEHKFRDHPDVARYPFDFFVPDLNLVIEYHGRQHKYGWLGDPKSASEIQARDKMKKEFVLREGMRFLEIDATTKSGIAKRLHAELGEIGKLRGSPLVLNARKLNASEMRALDTAFMWNAESVQEVISKCRTIKEFREKYPAALAYARKNESWKELSKTLERNKDPGKYTKEYVLSMAQQCKTRKEFRAKFSGCWSAAQRNGWIAEVCKHMPKHLQKPWLG